MSDVELTQRLAAILVADVAGYSRLMQDDEPDTVAALDQARAIFRSHVDANRGRVVDMAGDSVLAVFGTATGAVQASLAIQSSLNEGGAQVPDNRRMAFRIGVHLGDVIEKPDGTIYGDGVNVAARLEGLAEPGGVVVSGAVHDSLRGRFGLGYAYLGEQSVKNLSEPVRAYHVTDEASDKPGNVRSDGPVLTDKPTLAVLPFTNLSGDAEQEYFADGISEDLITNLSHIGWLFVTARNSTFTYKGKSVDVKQIGRDLAVRYVVQGSVRRSGERVRASAQLIDATTGTHVWAEKYDRQLADLFDLQDEITNTVAAAIEPEIGLAERERARRKPSENLDAWECYQRGLWHLYRFNRNDNVEAQALFRRAASLDPGFSSPLAMTALSHLAESVLGTTVDHDANRDRAMTLTREAMSRDEADPMPHMVMGRIYYVQGDFAAAMAAEKNALALNPNLSVAHFYLGQAVAALGRLDEALTEFDTAMRLSPRDPFRSIFESEQAITLSLMERYDEALAAALTAVRRPGARQWEYATVASVLGHLGRSDEAQQYLSDLFAEQPDFSLDFAKKHLPFWPPKHRDHFFEGLRRSRFDRAEQAE